MYHVKRNKSVAQKKTREEAVSKFKQKYPSMNLIADKNYFQETLVALYVTRLTCTKQKKGEIILPYILHT